MLDVRFSRRWYATVLAGCAAVFAAIAFLSLHRLLLLELTLTLANASANLFGAALGGWLSNIIGAEDRNILSKWMNVAMIGGMGIASMLGGELARILPISLAAVFMGLIVFLPTAVFLVIPTPGPDRRLAAESFGQFPP
jgi:MFS transporter, PAT family, beta-lactamase induction signal transducer AmpG